MAEDLTIILTPSGPIMGKLIPNSVYYDLHRPRVLVIQNAGGGMAKVVVSELIGKPELLKFTGEIIAYTPTDPGILQAYAESVSTIKVASSMPARPRVN